MNENRTITRLFWIIAGAVALIAAGSFAWSFLALWELAAGNSTQPTLGWVWPLTVDLSMMIYAGGILVAQLQRRPARLPIGLTIFYSLVTIAGNVLHAPPTPLAWFVAIMPPLSLIFAVEMLRLMGHHIIERSAAVATLAELSAQVDNTRRTLAEAQATKEATLDKLNGQIEQTSARLELVRSELKAAHFQQNARSVAEMNAARAAKIEARRDKVLEMLQAEMPHDAIAAELGFSVRTIRNDIRQLNGKAQVSR